jgi:hypothetical protein
MTDDIVERLRLYDIPLTHKAADEIERLRKSLIAQHTPQRAPGCICPPEANKTCQAPFCPRKPMRFDIGTGTAP